MEMIINPPILSNLAFKILFDFSIVFFKYMHRFLLLYTLRFITGYDVFNTVFKSFYEKVHLIFSMKKRLFNTNHNRELSTKFTLSLLYQVRKKSSIR